MNLNKYIDHTVLKADTTYEMIEKLCNEAREYDFASVCVNPYWVSTAKQLLTQTDVDICTVIGFPLGANTTAVKACETIDAVRNGATEIDMVINISALKEKNYDYILTEINAVCDAAGDKLVKVIVETALLTEEEKEQICLIVKESDATFIKTSTGFSTGGATKEDIMLFKSIMNGEKKIKASGGVRTLEDAQVMIAAGADRIGTSGGVSIINGQINTENY